MGRPSKYTPEVANYICGQIVMGRSLTAICKEEKMPSAVSVHDWFNKGDLEPDKYPEYKCFLNSYLRAKETQADTLADEVLEIADACSANNDSVNKAKMQIDARKWACGKMKPKKYGKDASTANGLADAVVEYVTSIRSAPDEQD